MFESEPIRVETDERTALAPVDHATFFAALDNPAKPIPRLREAFARHRARVFSR